MGGGKGVQSGRKGRWSLVVHQGQRRTLEIFLVRDKHELGVRKGCGVQQKLGREMAGPDDRG